MSEFAAYVGWDWADRQHDLCVRSKGRSEKVELKATPEAIHEWTAEMRRRYAEGKVAVCIETSRGAAIWALMGYEHIVLFPTNPKSVASFRETFHPSGKKDDPGDAEIMCELVEKHHDRLRRLDPADDSTRALGLLSEHRRKLVQEKVRIQNRMTSALKGYFPQALELCGEIDSVMGCDFLERWPELDAIQRAKESTVRSFYRQHGSRSKELIEKRVTIIRTAVPLTDDDAVVESGAVVVRTLLMVMRALLGSIDMIDAEIEQRYAKHVEHDLIDSFPGLGPVLGPRVISLLGSDRARFESSEELQLLTGVAPVTRRTGGARGPISVHRRLRRSKFLHQTIVEWAGCSIQRSAWAQAFYQQQLEAGHSRWSALRKLGYKWLRILFHCWASLTPYDEALHQASLLKHGSPLAARLAA